MILSPHHFNTLLSETAMSQDFLNFLRLIPVTAFSSFVFKSVFIPNLRFTQDFYLSTDPTMPLEISSPSADYLEGSGTKTPMDGESL